ncbi:ParB/RepB/Spo0J family partition protein [Candidatus Bathyarchaeota archaeon]|nr:ParB/RepB/Spo0J family partition protein [Candidatus Bathyarchaeota archaeon]
MVLKLPSDFAKKISEVLCLQEQGVDALFEFSETKEGYFIAQLKPKQFLDKAQFRTMCALARDLGGEGYIEGAKAWKIPGPYAKSKTPSVPETDFLASHKAPGNALPAEPSGKVVFAMLPVQALLSTPFQSRDDPDDPELADLAESLKAYGVLEPIVVRQKPNGLYEIAIGERRVKAARKAGLVEVPAIVRAMSDEEVAVCNLIENIHRKDLSDKEKTKALGEIARTWGLNAQQIAEEVRMSYAWVAKYLPDEFKDKTAIERGIAGGQATAEAYRESQDTSLRRQEESEDTRQGIPCARCGDVTSHPFSAPDKKMYCDEGCYRQAKEESESESRATSETDEEVGKEEAEEKETSKTEKETSRSEQLRAVQIGEFECTECNKRFLVEHMKNGKHRLKPIREDEEK